MSIYNYLYPLNFSDEELHNKLREYTKKYNSDCFLKYILLRKIYK